ncbi:MAG: hypothetical protein ACYDGN_16810 [Acidimicrobiales bacterium]
MTSYAVVLQVFLLTRSSLSVGLVGLAVAILAITVALIGGALYGVTGLPSMRSEGAGSRPGLIGVGKGVRFVLRQRMVLGAFVADTSATFLEMPTAT